jgi:hypothetical protein
MSIIGFVSAEILFFSVSLRIFLIFSDNSRYADAQKSKKRPLKLPKVPLKVPSVPHISSSERRKSEI